MIKVTSKRKEIITGITLEMQNDDATALSRALREFRQYHHKREYPWLNNFIDTLDKARGTGGGTFGRTPMEGA